jgi:membrane protein
MPTQSIATTTAKQHSHTGTSDASAPPRRPLLEAWVIAGGVGMIASAAIVCLQGGVLASLTGVEQVLGWLLAAWSASILAQSVITLRQSHRTDRYWQRIGALGLLLVNGALFIVGWLSGGVLHTPVGLVVNNTTVLMSNIPSFVGSLYLWYVLLGMQPAIPAKRSDVDDTTLNQMMKRKTGLWLMLAAAVPMMALYGMLVSMLFGVADFLSAHWHVLKTLLNEPTLLAMGMVASIVIYAGIAWFVVSPVMAVAGFILVATSKYE